MFSTDLSCVIVFNGEAYNYQTLRAELEARGQRFRSQSDTEVVLAAYQAYGLDFCSKLVGDFSLAIWDKEKRKLVLARDRLGVHPLYFYRSGRVLVFGSELKSVLACNRTPRDLDYSAVDEYLTLRYVPGGNTLFKSVEKLPAGSVAEFSEDGKWTVEPYWELPLAEHWRGSTVPTVAQAEEELALLLGQAVRMQTAVSGPVGSFLSGGIDSTLLTHLASRAVGPPLHTFSFGAGTAGDDAELDAARRVATEVGSEHHEVKLRGKDYELLPKIVWHLDEPLGDSIIVANFLLAKEASRHVKVVLSGEGADEVWAGYVHHLTLGAGASLRRFVPGPATSMVGRLVASMPEKLLSRFFPYPASLGERGKRVLGQYLCDLSRGRLDLDYLALSSVFREDDKRSALTSDFQQAAQDARTGQRLGHSLRNVEGSPLGAVLDFDMANWLPDYTLLRQDKIGLACGVEVRVPYLDHRIVEFAASLPPSYKILGLKNKRLLRNVARGLLGKAVARTPKRAFVLPIEKTFGPGFDDWTRDLLGSTASLQRGILSPKYVRTFLKRGRTSELVANKQLMALIVLELWFRTYVDGGKDF